MPAAKMKASVSRDQPPAGRSTKVRPTGALGCGEGVSSFGGERRGSAGFCGAFRQEESPAVGIVIENFAVASPMKSGLELTLGFVLAEMFVQYVAKQFILDGVVGLGAKDAVDLTQDRNVLERSFAEQYLAVENIRFREPSAFWQ